MQFKKRNRAAKLEFRCFQCKGSCAAKDGDWHSSPDEGSHQVFLCRDCERRVKSLSKVKLPIASFSHA